jgi:murein DD-endopeptidase MepM/ murein hydrolase activator NlpD
VTHGAVVALIVVAFAIDRLHVPAAAQVTLLTAGPPAGPATPASEALLPAPAPPAFLALSELPLLHTTVLMRERQSAVNYAVLSGDTLFGIAQKFGISGETLIWANGLEQGADQLRIGQPVVIPPVSGVYYTVRKGDTVQSLAKRFKVAVEAITHFAGNQLQPPYDLATGSRVMVPGGQQPMPVVQAVVHAFTGPVPADAAHGSGLFGWPTSGAISQKFWSGHPAVDIAGTMRESVYAADGGYVALAGWSNAGYGNMILIDHGNGFQTLYGHLDALRVRQGQSVTKGQLIGLMGCTGNCTGPHLHFEVRKGGVSRNPLGVLP